MTELNAARRHVHPFPARMAPEVALQKIELLTEPGQVVLDPMCGSGTVVRAAVKAGRRGIGADLDPLAVMITGVECNPAWSAGLEARAQEVVRCARRQRPSLPSWLARDAESRAFVEYWFAPEQIAALSRLAKVLVDLPRRDHALRVALSRLVITKDAGASLARDTAHSRPHRVRDDNDCDVFSSYAASAGWLEARCAAEANFLRPSIRRCDARHLAFVARGTVDLVVTSPPYLNAIDYLRGHRMSLVWLGWTLAELRQLRGTTIGAERGIAKASPAARDVAGHANPDQGPLTARHRGMVLRFASDIDQLCKTLGRVLKPDGHAVLVVADSQLRRVPVANAAMCCRAASLHKLDVIDRQIRPLPAHHRYLPPPSAAEGALSQRMKEEVVLTLRRAS